MSAALLPAGPAARAATAALPDSGGGALPARLRRLGDQLPGGVVLLVLAGQLLLPGGWAGAAAGRAGGVLVALGLLAGLPHGAVDHLLPAWVHARRTSPLALTALLVGYVCAAAAMYAVLRLVPLVGLGVFLALSLLHFGTGELAYACLRHSGTRQLPTRPAGLAGWAVAVLAWGGTAVLVPLACRPPQVAPVLEALAPGSRAVLTPAVTTAVAGTVLSATAVTLVRDGLAGRWRQAGELALLTVLFATVAPLVAFACYFGGWHALRHTVRLVQLDPANRTDLASGRLARPLRHFARQAAPPTAAALLALALLLIATVGRHSHLDGAAGDWLAGGWVAADLILLATLTAPHLLAVAWLDRHQPAAPPQRAAAR